MSTNSTLAMSVRLSLGGVSAGSVLIAASC